MEMRYIYKTDEKEKYLYFYGTWEYHKKIQGF